MIVFYMKSEKFLSSYLSNPMDIVDHIASLDTELTNAKEETQNLKALFNQNSQNSDKPPSNGFFDNKISKSSNSRELSGKLPGGQKGHPGSTLKMSKYPDEIITNQLHNCKYCDESILKTKVKGHEKRQKFDIIINHKVIEYRSEIKKCPYCGRKNKADFPDNITNPVQYGQRVLAIAVYLRNFQLIPYERISRTFKDFFGLTMSSATVQKAENKCSHNLKKVTNYIKNKLIKEDVINCDETGISINGKEHYCHVISTGKLTFYFHHRNRGSIAMDKMGVLQRFRGVAVNDFWKPYFKYKKCEHAVCNVHILRELKEIYKNETQEWALERVLKFNLISQLG